MKTTIYYFSGSGNSLAAALELGSLMKTGLLPMAGTLHKEHEVCLSERIGLVFPMYFWGIPRIVEGFLKKLRAPHASYIFCVVSCGFPAGYALRQAHRILKAQTGGLSAGWYLKMPDNYLVLYSTSPGSSARRLEKASLKLRSMAEKVSMGHKGICDSPLPFRWLSALVHAVWRRRLKRCSRHFHVNMHCSGCGICARICPVHNISVESGKPLWDTHCEQCFACVHFCPETAINYGRLTAGKPRYHHPDIDLRAMQQQADAPAENQARRKME